MTDQANPQYLIGAAADCDIVIDRSKISGHHARLAQVGRTYVLEDLGSTNGTVVDGVRISTSSVTHASRIGFGSFQTDLDTLLRLAPRPPAPHVAQGAVVPQSPLVDADASRGQPPALDVVYGAQTAGQPAGGGAQQQPAPPVHTPAQHPQASAPAPVRKSHAAPWLVTLGSIILTLILAGAALSFGVWLAKRGSGGTDQGSREAQVDEKVLITMFPNNYLEVKHREYYDKGIINDYRTLTSMTVLNRSRHAIHEMSGEVDWLDAQGRKFGSVPFTLKGSIPAGDTKTFTSDAGTLTNGTIQGDAKHAQIRFTRVSVVEPL
jgi:hypothetical protein